MSSTRSLLIRFAWYSRFPPHILVVVDRPGLGEVLLHQQRIIQVGHVPDQRPRPVDAALSLVPFVAHEEVAVVVGQPALVRVADVGILAAGDGDGVLAVGHVGDAQRGFVCAEADLAALVVLVRPPVDNALGVVGVAGALAAGGAVGEAAQEDGLGGGAHVDHVQAAATSFAAHAATHRVQYV